MRTLPEIIREALNMAENVAIPTANDLTSDEEFALKDLADFLDKLGIDNVTEIKRLFVDEFIEDTE